MTTMTDLTFARYWRELQSRPPRVIPSLLNLLRRKPVWEVDDGKAVESHLPIVAETEQDATPFS